LGRTWGVWVSGGSMLADADDAATKLAH
jgi:hypothetical protein